MNPDPSSSAGRTRSWHPVLLALGPVVFLWAHNVEQVPFGMTLLPAAICVTGAVISWAALNLVLRNPQKSALLTSFGLACFFGYGFTLDLLYAREVFGFQFGRIRYLVLLQGLIFIVGAIAILRTTRPLEPATRAANVFATLFLASSVFTIATHSLAPASVFAEDAPTSVVDPKNAGELPNIFYLVMDGYGREDTLREFHGVENSSFVGFLEDNGFYVADSSHSNYCATLLSLYASLNLEYADKLAQRMGVDSSSVAPLHERIMNSVVTESLKPLGYEFHSYKVSGIGHYLEDGQHGEPEGNPFVFASMLVDRTPLGMFKPFTAAQYDRHRYILDFEFNWLEELATTDGPAFVLAHAIVPHPPFVFAADGSPANPPRGYVLDDGEVLADYIAKEGRTLEDQYSRPYGEQLAYLNGRLETIVTAIQQSATRPTVIIIQGDHGPGAYLRNDVASTNVHDRFSIMNAYYFDDGDYGSLYAGISPVNSFRMIFNKYFGTEFEPLDDRSFWSQLKRPYEHIEVTDALRAGNSEPKAGIAPASHDER